MANEIPVYLFVGFLESGKTKFIQETFEDPNFDSGDKTLLLVCEEGEEEYNQKKFAFPGVTLYNLEDKAELNPQNLAKLAKEADAGRVVIEYNGMWMLQDLANNLPENWIVYQCIATADGTTALTYARDNSMRALMLDKIARSELIVFNRAEAVNNDAAVRSCTSWCVRHPASATSPTSSRTAAWLTTTSPTRCPLTSTPRSSTSRTRISAYGKIGRASCRERV